MQAKIPIIFITAYPDETIKARALSAGALCFLHKPIDLQGRRLVDCLYTALDRGKGTSPDQLKRLPADLNRGIPKRS